MSQSVGVVQLGLCHYRHALKIQEHIATRLRLHQDPSLSGVMIMVEHPPVYTTGIRKGALKQQDIIKLQALGAEVAHAERGGLVTFHGPGQMVAWPVLKLKDFFGIKKYINSLEESVIKTCNKLGLNDVGRNPAYPGVWRGEAKICALGARASRYITTHGLALNVCTDLSWFQHIVPCGIEDKQVTSLSQELKRKINIQEVSPIFMESFSEVFKVNLVDIPEQFDRAVSSI